MKAFLTVLFLASASAQLPPMMSSYMPYGGMPIVSGPPVVNSPPMVTRSSMMSGAPLLSGSSIMSGGPMISGSSILSSGGMQPVEVRDESCVVRCVRQCQNEGSSAMRTVDLTSFQPSRGNNGGTNNNGFNVGLTADFPSGMSSETSRLTIAPSTKGSSQGQISVKG
ncbi:uncharacterized protein LOC100904679 [Galendromus occidentalis]|uniref:Uncharacterized protein LOC100904679 n=1 Tax=Galendromus occidentalis TaxID=34638 RepID=A0AAJ6W0A0_9ACAR|nr:uncharacterized protein LOC100904679 [Galendromus occidentalis]